jgi:dynactin complex subunit
MKIFKKIINWIFGQSKSSIIIPDASLIEQLKTEQYVCEINFQLTESNDIDISFKHNNVSEYSVEQISLLAENCANLVVLINNGLLKKELIGSIKQLKKANMNNDKTTLFLDNILFFNGLLQEELKSIKKENGPLIKPSSVFK